MQKPATHAGFSFGTGRPQQVMQGGRSVIGGFSGVMRGSMAGSGIW
jgi:hypothetical protein